MDPSCLVSTAQAGGGITVDHLLMATSTRITGQVTQNRSSQTEFTDLQWPPQSADLSPTEQLWKVVEQEVLLIDVQHANHVVTKETELIGLYLTQIKSQSSHLPPGALRIQKLSR
ncbi:hypothetical protein ILYODFUR_030853 [Ilyodon furcidens]|uniref:Uncharacterized protein n=1 Tax=Ilyodon furcidens TaxID=33524 RepID=A0ABV0U0X7_9TELE